MFYERDTFVSNKKSNDTLHSTDNIEKTDFLDILKKLGIFCKLIVSTDWDIIYLC